MEHNLIPLVSTAPTFDPITIEQAKKQLEISLSDLSHDDHLGTLITAAREEVERDTGIVLASTSFQVLCDCMYDGMQLQRNPVQSITLIRYYDTGNAIQTLSSSIYAFDVAHRKIRLKYAQVFPATVTERYDAWEITYLAGYSTLASVPALAKAACLLLVGHYFSDRGDMLKESDQRKYDKLVAKLQRGTYP